VVEAFESRFAVTVETVRTRDESVSFKLPRELRSEAGQDAA
jgi:4-hydroxy-3-methylbut-2-enyl diphosphate reductase